MDEALSAMLAASELSGRGKFLPRKNQHGRLEKSPFLIGDTWVFPKIGVPQNGWFIMEHSIKMDDLGVPPF